MCLILFSRAPPRTELCLPAVIAVVLMSPSLTAFLPCITFLLGFLTPPKSITCAQIFASASAFGGAQIKAVIIGQWLGNVGKVVNREVPEG